MNDSLIFTQLAANIRLLKADNHLSHRQIAGWANCSIASVSDWAAGKKKCRHAHAARQIHILADATRKAREMDDLADLREAAEAARIYNAGRAWAATQGLNKPSVVDIPAQPMWIEKQPKRSNGRWAFWIAGALIVLSLISLYAAVKP